MTKEEFEQACVDRGGHVVEVIDREVVPETRRLHIFFAGEYDDYFDLMAQP